MGNSTRDICLLELFTCEVVIAIVSYTIVCPPVGGVMVMGKLPVPGCTTNWDISRARSYCSFSRCGYGLFGQFFSHLLFVFLFPVSGRRPNKD